MFQILLDCNRLLDTRFCFERMAAAAAAAAAAAVAVTADAAALCVSQKANLKGGKGNCLQSGVLP